MKHVGPISGIASYDSRYIATAGYDNQVILWDAEKKIPLMRGMHDHLTNQCAFSHDGRMVVSASSDYTARIWCVPEMRLTAVLQGHDDDLEMAVFHPDNKRVATCSRDHTVRTYHIDGTLINVMKGHTADVISIGWDETSNQLISSSDDGTIRTWDSDNGALLKTIDLDGIETDTIVITETGVAYAGNDEGDILTIHAGRVEKMEAHKAGIKRLAYSSQDKLLVSLSYDRKLILWDIDPDGTLTFKHTANFPAIVWPRSCAFLDDKRIVFGTFGSQYAVYNHDTEKWDLDGIVPDISLNAVAWWKDHIYAIGDSGKTHCDGRVIANLGSLCNFLLPFGDLILTGGQMGTLFDAISEKIVFQHHSPLNVGATFVRDKVPHAIVGTYTGEGIVLRQLEPGKVDYVCTIQLDQNAIKGIACSDDKIFSVCATGAAAFHNISDLAEEFYVKDAHDRIANGCSALPDGRFVSISRDLNLRIWDGDNAQIFLSPHKNSIKCIAVSRNGKFVATGSYGGTIAIFDTETLRWSQVVRPTTAGISSLSVAGREGYFLASDYDGEIYDISAN